MSNMHSDNCTKMYFFVWSMGIFFVTLTHSLLQLSFQDRWIHAHIVLIILKFKYVKVLSIMNLTLGAKYSKWYRFITECWERWRAKKRKNYLLSHHTVVTTCNVLLYISFDFKKWMCGYLCIFPEVRTDRSYFFLTLFFNNIVFNGCIVFHFVYIKYNT